MEVLQAVGHRVQGKRQRRDGSGKMGDGSKKQPSLFLILLTDYNV